MPLPSPNLDDRDFQQLMKESLETIGRSCPDWKFSVGDPGFVLLEAFAHLTETMIYRLNRIPEKAYIEFLRLIDVRLQPPAAASVSLKFKLAEPAANETPIRRGTRVTMARGASGTEPVVFTTAVYAEIPAGALEVDVLAHHCDLVEGELAGTGTGAAGLSVKAIRPPIIAPTGQELDLVVGVEALPGELDLRIAAIEFGGKAFRIWREVDNFADLEGDRFIYVVDRMTGQITFAPSAQVMEGQQLKAAAQPLAEVPAAGREIRLWYRRGGGAGGNVSARALETLKNPLKGVTVTNPAPATGGRDAETLPNALVRGPQELHSLRRAVTANDFEVLARRTSGAMARAHAFTRSMIWVHAAPGTVEVLLVPAIPPEERPGEKVSLPQLQARQTAEALGPVQEILDERRPLGTTCIVRWAQYKPVRVQARIVTREQEDPETVQKAVLKRLYSLISPLPTELQPSGWRFGQALRVSNIYDAALSHPGVSYIDRVKLIVDEVPESDVRTLRADCFQPRQLPATSEAQRPRPSTWYAGSGGSLFRSMDDGDGWEVVGRFDGIIRCVAVHSARAGILAVATLLQGDNGGSALYISRNCGESWEDRRTIAATIESAAWIMRGEVPVLLFAADAGLFELPLQPDATPLQVEVRADGPEQGYYAVATAADSSSGGWNVAVASQSTGGVYLSSDGGKSKSFRPIGLKGQDVRVLEIQRQGLRSFLWAGLAAPSAGDPGTGCQSWELLGADSPPEKWQTFGKNWTGGSCKSIAFRGAAVVAGSHHAGALVLPGRTEDAAWQVPDVGCGLPLREADQLFHPVEAVASDPEGKFVMAGGPKGIYRNSPAAAAPASYENCSSTIFLDRVTLPSTWLFCSSDHYLDVVPEDEA